MQRLQEFSIHSHSEHCTRFVAWKRQKGCTVRRIPQRRIVEIRVLHLSGGVQHTRGFQIAADLNDAGAFELKVGLATSRPEVDAEAAMRGGQHFLSLLRQMIRGVEHPELQCSLAADAASC